MTELSENLNTNLDKLRIATGGEEQRKLLTDILVESELMESALEKFPVEQATTNNISSFVNRTAAYAREGLDEISAHGELGMENGQSLEYMYETNGAILQELQTLRGSMSEKDWARLSKNAKNGRAGQTFDNVNSNVIQTPSTIQDGPFSENKQKVTAHGLENESPVTSAKATALVREYFADRDIATVDYKGETVAENATFYNFTLKDTRGREMYAQLSKAGGKLVMFNSYEKCSAVNFTQEKCVEIAQEFLANLGMENMRAVWLQENGTTANINFVYEQDGVLCYSDMAIVKVCETKGKVIGLEAMPYYLNHGEREISAASVSEEDAAGALGRLTPATQRLALIPYNGSELLCYEFSGTYQDHEFFVYVDAASGQEAEAFTVLNTKQGRVIM
jgi:germination protein YpeB